MCEVELPDSLAGTVTGTVAVQALASVLAELPLDRLQMMAAKRIWHGATTVLLTSTNQY